ncbi:hypothetical protein NQZ68_001889 [Dissostichus eleginoides]|nr:hypothetical protein NQZ68_001889 [Dissostichus eleginoides]
MHTRRLVKRSILGSRVCAPSPTGDGAPVTGVVQAVKQENRDVSTAGSRCSVYTVLLQDGSLKEFSEEEIAAGFNNTAAKGPLKSSLKTGKLASAELIGWLNSISMKRNGHRHCYSNGAPESHQGEGGSLSPEAVEEQRMADGKRVGRDPDTRSVSLLEQKRKVVSSSIDVPHAR